MKLTNLVLTTYVKINTDRPLPPLRSPKANLLACPRRDLVQIIKTKSHHSLNLRDPSLSTTHSLQKQPYFRKNHLIKSTYRNLQPKNGWCSKIVQQKQGLPIRSSYSNIKHSNKPSNCSRARKLVKIIISSFSILFRAQLRGKPPQAEITHRKRKSRHT